MVWMMMLGTMATSQLTHADVEITFREESVTVEARYTLATPADSVVFTAMQIRGQRVIPNFDSRLDQTLGGYRWTTVGTRTPTLVVLVYSVVGKLTRIPIFVPDVTTPLAERVVELRVLTPADVRLVDTFPRFQPEDPTSLISVTGNLPSFVYLPTGSNRISIHRSADLGVGLLLLFATAFWLWRRVA